MDTCPVSQLRLVEQAISSEMEIIFAKQGTVVANFGVIPAQKRTRQVSNKGKYCFNIAY